MNSHLILSETHKTRKVLKKVSPLAITPLTIDDIDTVVSLSRKYFPRSQESSINTQKKRMVEYYFSSGKLLPDVSPLVSRTENGSVNGFLGVTTKPFRYRDSIITIANCHHLMATEEARKQLIPMRLLQQFLSGPQDLSFSDGSSDSTRQLWKRLGGEFVTGESIYYKIPLRPASFAAGYLLKQNRNRMDRGIRFLASCTDSIAGRMRIPLFYRKETDIDIVPLDKEMMGVLMEKLKPIYQGSTG